MKLAKNIVDFFGIEKKDLIIVGIIMLAWFLNPIERNELGYRQVVQPPVGAPYVIFDPGIHFVFPGTKITTWPNTVTITATHEEIKTDTSVAIQPVKIRFNDGSTAEVSYTCRFDLPYSPVDMISINEKYSTLDVLRKNLPPLTSEVAQNSAKLMSSDEHYNGGETTFKRNFVDQLYRGLYLTEVVDEAVLSPVTNERVDIKRHKIIYDETQEPRRMQNVILAAFGITVHYATITNVEYSREIERLIESKIEAKARQQMAHQRLITEEYHKKVVAAEWERRIIEAKYEGELRRIQAKTQTQIEVK